MGYDEAFWERYFHHYDALDGAPPYRDLQDRVAVLAAPVAGLDVLDAGCGTGNLVPRLEARGARVVALDANRAGLRAARRKVAGLAVVHATLESGLPFADAAFDAVASVNVLYTLSPPGRARFLAEARRVLRPGGGLVVASPRPGWKPLAIYRDAVHRWLGDLGLVGGAARILRFAPPTAAIFYYNAQIQRLDAGRAYSFLGPDELATELRAAGLAPEPAERAYADQVVLVRALRPDP